ncbi:discoidin domain-containing protein [Paenibacillus sp. ALJ109b]|uniref:discoidin domain-containing protein n=1 Tax=Paenibacillus sp. ALJ109b TaxID=2709068 RepID=UPI0031F676FF
MNTSIRPGWFYHASEDVQVKSLDELLSIYDGTVGGNANFLLNLPPDRRGLIHEQDVERLQQLGDFLRSTYRQSLAVGASIRASDTMGQEHAATQVLREESDTFWCPSEGTELAWLEVELPEETRFDRVVLMEHIRLGQRIERFTLEAKEESGDWQELYRGTIVGHKRICSFEPFTAKSIRLAIHESRCIQRYPGWVYI